MKSSLPKVTPIPQKITQIQCEQCNKGLHQMFLLWLTDSFKYLPGVISSCYNELELLLSFAEYRLTISMDQPQPGDFLQNIQFKPLSRGKKVLWFLLSVFIPYLKKKLTPIISQSQRPIVKKIFRVIQILEKFIIALQFLNYAIFISKGQYRNLIHRVLNIKMKFINENNKRILNFSLMNRMMLWQIYELFLKTVLPEAFNIFGGPLKNIFYLNSYMQIDNKNDDNKCIFCGSSEIVMPMQIKNCRHKGCYYCITSNEAQKCKSCGKQIDEWVKLY